MADIAASVLARLKNKAACKCQYKNVGLVLYFHVGKPTWKYSIFFAY